MDIKITNKPVVIAISDANKWVGSRVVVEDDSGSRVNVATGRHLGVLSWETETEIKRDK